MHARRGLLIFLQVFLEKRELLYGGCLLQQRDEDWGDFGGYETAAQDMPLAPIQAAKDDTPMNVNQKKPDGHSSPNNDVRFAT